MKNDPPTRPTSPPSEAPLPRSGWLGVGLILVFLVSILGATAVFAPVLVFVVVSLLAVAGLNYLIWGWWLGPALRRESEEEEHTP